MKSMEGNKVLVIGLADSGYASSIAARELGADVTIVDSSSHPARENSLDELKEMGVKVELGVGVPEDLGDYETVITSPGVPDHAQIIVEARKIGKRVISELEFGYKLTENRIVAITGTNGKTTTTRLISWILDLPERRAFACGNIGKPLVSLCGSTGKDDLLIVEVSSFQLRNIEEFRGDVSVILNVAPDHFDWHTDLNDYKRSKMRLVENMHETDYLVYYEDDRFCREMAEVATGRVVGFSINGAREKGIWIENGWIVTGEPFNTGRVIPVDEIKLRGVHNLANVCAAVGAALCMEERPQRIREAVGSFNPLEHRMEYVCEVDGVEFYNDSKATNPHAAIHSVKSFDGPLAVILGGRNKGLDFGELVDEIKKRMDENSVVGLVLLGESADELKMKVGATDIHNIETRIVNAVDMDDAVKRALEMVSDGGIVLFSPACASFDMYANYKDRGRAFKESVRSLKGCG